MVEDKGKAEESAGASLHQWEGVWAAAPGKKALEWQHQDQRQLRPHRAPEPLRDSASGSSGKTPGPKD